MFQHGNSWNFSAQQVQAELWRTFCYNNDYSSNQWSVTGDLGRHEMILCVAYSERKSIPRFSSVISMCWSPKNLLDKLKVASSRDPSELSQSIESRAILVTESCWAVVLCGFLHRNWRCKFSIERRSRLTGMAHDSPPTTTPPTQLDWNLLQGSVSLP
jgi:hypothetical protein